MRHKTSLAIGPWIYVPWICAPWIFALCASASVFAASAPDDSIEEIIVTGEFRSDPLDALPSSISVATAAQIASLQAQHLE